MNDCIFCKIAKREIPSNIIYEDDKSIAFLDIAPVNPGHALLISKKHYEDLLATDGNMLKHLSILTKKITTAIIKAVNADGANVTNNIKKAAGQIIFHTHIHIIPRFNNDNLGTWPHKKYKENEAEKITSKIRSFLK